MDEPMDHDGGLYVSGFDVCVRSKRTARGYTMGGVIAQTYNEQTAREIVRRCTAYEPLLSALREAEAALGGGAPVDADLPARLRKIIADATAEVG
jgi:hypothetical protein